MSSCVRCIACRVDVATSEGVLRDIDPCHFSRSTTLTENSLGLLSVPAPTVSGDRAGNHCSNLSDTNRPPTAKTDGKGEMEGGDNCQRCHNCLPSPTHSHLPATVTPNVILIRGGRAAARSREVRFPSVSSLCTRSKLKKDTHSHDCHRVFLEPIRRGPARAWPSLSRFCGAGGRGELRSGAGLQAGMPALVREEK